MSEKRKGAVAPTPEEETSIISPFSIQEKRGDGSVARFSSLEQFAENLPDLLAALDEADAAIRAEMEKQYNLETMRAFTPEVASMPFAHDLKINEVLYRGLGHASEDTLDWADKETNGGARRYLFFCMNLRYTFLSSMIELEIAAEEEAAEFERLGLKLDEFEHVDLTSFPVTLNCEKEDGLPLGYMKGEEESYPYQGIRDPQDVFNILRSLYCLGLENFLVSVIEENPTFPTRRKESAQKKKRQAKAKTDTIKDSNDVVSNALFYRPERQRIEPWDYMTGERKILKSGKDISVAVTLNNDFSLDQALEEWRLDSTDRFWHSMALSLASKGYSTFRGSDLLELGGYKKPTAKDMQETMLSCHMSLLKMRRHDILIDTSGEHKAYKSKRGAELLQATTLRSLLNADITYLNFEDGVNDFKVTLNAKEGGDPISAFALGEYAESKNQLLSFSKNDFDFKKKRLTNDHRRVWMYVLQQIKGRKTSNTIKFETMLLNVNLDGINRDQRKRLLNQLKQMLDVRVSEHKTLQSLKAKKKLTIAEQKEVERLESCTLISGYKWNSKDGSVTIEPSEK